MTRLVAGTGQAPHRLMNTCTAAHLPSAQRPCEQLHRPAREPIFSSTDAGSTGLNASGCHHHQSGSAWNPAVLEQRIARIYRIGQQNNIQVINLVAPNSIEEQMLGKLRSNRRCSRCARRWRRLHFHQRRQVQQHQASTVGEMMKETEKTAEKTEEAVTMDEQEPQAEESKPSEDTPPARKTLLKSPTRAFPSQKTRGNHPPSLPKSEAIGGSGRLIPSGLAKTLKSQEATVQLINQLVKPTRKPARPPSTSRARQTDRETVTRHSGKLFG